MGFVRIVNMIPAGMSGETFQDSEPNIAVNPERPTEMVGSAFTVAPLSLAAAQMGSGSFSPIYVSTDGGSTWALRNIVPGNGRFGTGDITVAFAPTGGTIYAAILNGDNGRMQILRMPSIASTTPMTVLLERSGPDQPWIVAAPGDRLFVANNDAGWSPRTALVDIVGGASASSPSFMFHLIEHRVTSGQDGPPVRVAFHPDGTVYAAFLRWATSFGSNVTFDVVVVRDDQWAGDIDKFFDLVDAADQVEGTRVASDRYLFFKGTMGQERLGGDLALAVDPTDSRTVWVAWCERVGGAGGTDWTLQVARSSNSGNSWAPILRTITNAKNPALAVNSSRLLGLAYQQFTGAQWVTRLELTSDAWATAPETHVLHQAPSNAPAQAFFPYLGDYIRLLAVGRDFYGVFSGNNTPNTANFPSGVTYQRAADWVNNTLLNNNGVSVVATSIDPFFFSWFPRRPFPISPVSRGPITPRAPIMPRAPIIPRTPIIPRAPIIPRGPIGPIPSSGSITREPAAPTDPEVATQQGPPPPTDLEL